MKKFLIIVFTFFFFIAVSQVGASSSESSQEKVEQVQVKNPAQIGVIKALRSASLIVQLTMILLALMSIVSWAIILSKWSLFKNNTANNAPFEDIFFKASSLDEIFDMSKSYPNSSLAVVFRSGYSELKKLSTQKIQLVLIICSPVWIIYKGL